MVARRLRRVAGTDAGSIPRPVRYAITAVVLTALVLVVVGAAGCARGRQAASGRMKVAATIIPLADFCRNVGGDLVEVQSLVPAQAGCGHEFEPTPSEVRFVADSRVLVENGLDLESWATSVISNAGSPRLEVIDTSLAIPRERLLPTRDVEQLKDAAPGKKIYDPHVWLDPSLAAYQVQSIRDGFIKADPAHRMQYTRNADAYVKELKALDSGIRETLSHVTEKEFVATHPSWTYFAPRYGLVQAGEVEELPGREPSIAQINALIGKVRDRRIKVVLAEPQLSPRAIEAIAEDSGPDVKVDTVDPIGDPRDPHVATYIKLMRHDAAVMEGALR